MRVKKNKIYGFGINDYEGSITNSDGKHLKSYTIWRTMISRCYKIEFIEKNPTYKDCTVCDEWKYFSNFKDWFDVNYRYDLVDIGIKIDLDKDLLCQDKERKIYSPKTCVFIPQKVNKFIINPLHNNKSGHVGIFYREKSNGYEASCSKFGTGKTIYLGTFKDKNEAILEYRKYKNSQIIECKKFLKELGYEEDIINKIKLLEL